jgi:hypothetical protein
MIGDRGQELSYVNGGETFIRQINAIAVARCERFAFARDEALLRSLVRATRIAGSKAPSKIRFF